MVKSESTLHVMQYLTLMAIWCQEQDCCRGHCIGLNCKIFGPHGVTSAKAARS